MPGRAGVVGWNRGVRMALVFWSGVSKRRTASRHPALPHGILALLAAALLSACQTSSVDRDTVFNENSDYAMVIAGARLNATAAANKEINTTNQAGLFYSIYWRRYDPKTDIATKSPGEDHFSLIIGASNIGRESCRFMDGAWRYCIYDVKPGHYVLESTITEQRTREGAKSYYYATFRTSLGVGNNYFGGISINNEIPVSESESQRFKLEPGNIYYLGEHTLGLYGQIGEHQFDKMRARRFLRNFRNVRGDLQVADLKKPYRPELRTGFCSYQKIIQAGSYTYTNPCQ